MAKLRLLIFDGDDTLWETQSLYDSAKSEFLSELAAEGLSSKDAKQLLEEVDVANVKQLGFSKSRFPLSLVTTYRRLCNLHGKVPNDRTEARIQSIGYSIFETKPNLIPTTEQTLQQLQNRYELSLCTKGDPLVQKQRIDQSGLERFFPRIYIVPTKEESQFEVILRDVGCDSDKACSIGNSIKSDINPALNLGMYAIFVPGPTWAFEESALGLDSKKLRTVSNLESIPQALAELESSE
jgi:putative hydrolase of the HAD superfamily